MKCGVNTKQWREYWRGTYVFCFLEQTLKDVYMCYKWPRWIWFVYNFNSSKMCEFYPLICHKILCRTSILKQIMPDGSEFPNLSFLLHLTSTRHTTPDIMPIVEKLIFSAVQQCAMPGVGAIDLGVVRWKEIFCNNPSAKWQDMMLGDKDIIICGWSFPIFVPR